MDRDYFSIHAQAPWTGTPSERQNDEKVPRKQESGRHLRGSGDTPEQIRCCLSCPMASCNNCMEGKRKGQLPEVRGMKEAAPKKSGKRGDPCTDCNAKLLCQANGWTCNAKARWEEKHG